MKKEKKNKKIEVRVSDKEKRAIEKQAEKQGFDSVSAYLLWLFRRGK